ncbi:unnamed protein product, partial [marine sediment metagenome]
QYLNDIALQMGKPSSDLQPLIRLLQTPRLIKFLTDQGYTTIAFESGYHPTELRSTDHYLSPKFTLTEFQNELINLTPLMVWLRNFQHDLQRTRIKFIFN